METSGNTWLNHLKVGKKLFAESNYPEAIDEFKKSIALKESWGGYLGLGMLLNQLLLRYREKLEQELSMNMKGKFIFK